MLHFAVKLNCLVKVILCLDGCANCFENKYISLEKSVKSTERNCGLLPPTGNFSFIFKNIIFFFLLFHISIFQILYLKH